MSEYRDWKTGDRVVCVYDSGTPQLVVGRFYTIAEFDRTPGYCTAMGAACDFGILLREVRPNAGKRSFAPMRFRKVQSRKTDISIFHSILNGHRISEDA